MKLLLLIFVFFCISLAQGQDPAGIQNIRELYNQKADFETLEISLDRLIPGRGEREGKIAFQYLDCHYLDCSEFGISDDVNGKVLRRVEVELNIDTENRKAEYLFDERGSLVFAFQRIASERYFEETGRDCGQERYYFAQQYLIRLKIDPCEASAGESLESILEESDFRKEQWLGAMATKRKAREYSDLFARVTSVQSLEGRGFSDDELQLASIGMIPGSIRELQVVEGRVAVFLTPIDFQNDVLEKSMVEEELMEVVDDNLYYFSEAQSAAAADGLEVIEPTERYILFDKSEKGSVLIDRYKLNPGWHVILFDGEKDPQLISALDISEAISSYFK